jgi:multiple sugar transport system substrate-binding protein
MLLGLVVGCGAPDDSQASTTISFLNPHPGAYDELIADFEKQNPTIRVEQQSVPFDQMVSQTQARLASKDRSIDVVSVDPPRLAGMVAQGFLTDESAALPRLKTSASAVGVDSVVVGGHLRAYPLWTSDAFLFYNRDALVKAGVPFPGPRDADRLTWEQVLGEARRVLNAGEVRYGLGIEQIDRYYALQPILMSMGASSGLEGPDNLTVSVNTAEWKQFGRWYSDLHVQGLAPRGVDPEQMPDLFISGQLAFYLTGPATITQIASSKLAGHWGIAPMPHFAGKPIVTPTDSWAVGISAFSKKQDAARQFVQFMTLRADGVIAASQTMNWPPVNTAAMSSYLNYLHQIAPAETSHLGELLETDLQRYAQHRPKSVGYVQFETTMNKAFADLRNGLDVDSVLDGAQSALTRQLNRERVLAGGR